MNTDRWLKRLWMTIGILLLPLVAYGAVTLVREWIKPGYGSGEAVQVADSGGAGTATLSQAIRYEKPERIFGSPATLVQVHYGSALRYGASLSGSGYEDQSGPIVNIIVLSPNEPEGRLLFDKPAFVRSVSFPSDPGDSLITWIAYDVAFLDTNGDHRLDSNDDSSLYVSDLYGQGLTRALPEGQSYISFSPGSRRGTILVYSLEIPTEANQRDRDRWRQRAFEYSVETRTATPYPALDIPAARAGEILSR